jgi:hypothetical protein
MSACFELAHMFRPGKDVRWSSSEKEGEALAKAVAIDSLAAVDSQQTACEGGDASACYTLGRLLHGGLGVRESRSKAAEYYRRACDGGDAAGCYELGEMQLVGDGIAADRWTAEELLEHACQGGVATACSHLEALVIEME